ncbi:hypothetical protein JKP75_08385 [Blastococcus sp. TML/M2B]|uniref:hypothetical protein n=1 Tax=unclassified Blastococcus TaxID=2619396 RepID=UPI001909569A|nr:MULTISPECIES: hypothetical protein [unclassified Blastococcus]MBN1092576.1 hypothetical protein [Blastococcus sp. TML/M2B]MBN1097330.1 hypothetical protein [Blastococcus sp. TML/C7B]
MLVLAGCTGEPEEIVRTSGPLAVGFEIEPGSGLVGAVFPTFDEGLHAFLRVDDDLPEVFAAYARQAEELGFPVAPPAWWPDGEWCNDDPELWNSSVTEDTAFAVECSAYGSSISERNGPPYWSMSLRGLAEADGGGYLEISGGSYSGEPVSRPPVEDGPVAEVTDDDVAPEDLAVYEDDQLRIVAGSELVFDPFPATCATGGWVAVLRVTGDLLPVMRGYAEQIDAMRAFTTEGLVGDAEQPSVSSWAAGGGDLSVVGQAGDPAHILISRCND